MFSLFDRKNIPLYENQHSKEEYLCIYTLRIENDLLERLQGVLIGFGAHLFRKSQNFKEENKQTQNRYNSKEGM